MNSVGKLNAAIYRNLQSILNTKLQNVSIRGGQYDFLYVISQNEGITQKELSEELYVDKSTTAKAVKSLISHGYVVKESLSKDKRFVQLYLTEQGKKIKPQMQKTFSELIEVSTRNLSEREAEQASSLLKSILDGLIEEKIRLSTKSE